MLAQASPTLWLGLFRRSAVVTGAGSGIGSCVAASLAGQGCNVLLADVDESGLERSAEGATAAARRAFGAVGGGGGGARAPVVVRSVACDVSDPESVRAMMREADAVAIESRDEVASSSEAASSSDSSAPRRPPPPPPPAASILVNCAGITRDALLQDMSVEDFDAVSNVNLRGSWLTSRSFCDADRLRSLGEYRRELLEAAAAGDGGNVGAAGRTVASIVNIGSVVSRSGNVGQTNYAASKGGVAGLTRALAREMARHGIRANCVLPGFIDTPMSRAVPEKVLEQIQAKIPGGSFGRPEDVADLALFLSSEERSGYITGECIECSGMIAL